MWTWLGELEDIDTAQGLTRRLPFLASIGVAVSINPDVHYDHLVIDEAQDIRPLEWRVILERLVRKDRITILGDLNQRRSDFTSASWKEVVRDAGLDVGGREPEVRTITTGYRTTRQIMEFANQLLLPAQRIVTALQNGVPPIIVKVTIDALIQRSIEEAVHLAQRYSSGQIAVITRQPRDVGDGFRKKGWSVARIPHAWTTQGMTVLVLEPNRARGLEFDGVVVVEPSSFPPNYGRHGLLYTSLTRAVRELIVVHSRPLPDELRRRR
jgi:DNA helicase IV